MTEERPILKIPRTPLEKGLDVVATAALVVAFVMAISCFGDLPAEIAIHFSGSGTPDGWAPCQTLFVFPGIATLVFVLLTVLSFYPQRFNYLWTITTDNAERQYVLARTFITALKTEHMLLLTFVERESIMISMGKQSQLHMTMLLVAMLVIGTTIGAYLVQSYTQK